MQSAKSPPRCASSSNAKPSPSAGSGQSVSTTSSSGSRRRGVRADEEVAAGISRRPLVDATTTDPSDGDEHERQLRGSVRVRERPADRAAVARDRVTDVREDGRERRMRLQRCVRLANGRADA